MRRLASLSAIVTCLCACATGTKGEGLTGGGGEDTTGPSGAQTAAGSGGATSTASTGGGGSGGASSSSAAVGTGGTGACPMQSPVTTAVHLAVDTTWPASAQFQAGSGTVHVWAKVTQMYNGNDFTGTSRLCGSLIPDATATASAGGKLVGATVPDAAWDSINMPSVPISGTQTGTDAGSTITVDTFAILLGSNLPNPLTDPWPASYTTLTQVDHDADGKPGVTLTAKTGATYQYPAVTPLMTTHADNLHLATRMVLSWTGTRDTCNSASGTATVDKLETHVLGCNVLGGSDCVAAQTQYLDDTRTVLAPAGATFVQKIVASSATCADVRAALP